MLVYQRVHVIFKASPWSVPPSHPIPQGPRARRPEARVVTVSGDVAEVVTEGDWRRGGSASEDAMGLTWLKFGYLKMMCHEIYTDYTVYCILYVISNFTYVFVDI